VNTQQHRHEWTPRNDDDSGGFACTECPATTTPCTICHRPTETSGRTCEPCTSQTRNHVREIRDMYHQLPDIIAAAAGLHAIRYDRTGGTRHRTTDTTIIGGSALVMAAGGYVNATLRGRHETTIDPALLDAERHDPPSVLAVLTFWEDTWRAELEHGAATRTSVDEAARYLVLTTGWAAQHSPTWDEYLTDLRALRMRLRRLTGATQPPVKAGVPCPYCAGTIVQHWTDSGLDDVRRCDTCRLEWASEAHFLLAIREAHQALPVTHPEHLVTIGDAKRIYKGRVRGNLLDLWVHRGTLAPVQHDGALRRDVRGELLYRLGDIDERVFRAEAG